MALMAKHWENSAIVAPLAGGALLDLQNNGLLLWLLMGGACLVVLPTLLSLKPRYGVTAKAENMLLTEKDKQFDAVTRNSEQQHW